MERTYDIFELLPDGHSIWRCSIVGVEPAIQRIRELGGKSQNEFRVMHLESKSLVAVINAKKQTVDSKGSSDDSRKAPKKKRNGRTLRQAPWPGSAGELGRRPVAHMLSA